MEEKNKSIHEFDVNLIIDYFSNLERQGSGSPETTIKALSLIDNVNRILNIADIGCGSGGQIMTLAQNTIGNIISIDLFPIVIEKFKNNAKKINLQNKVKALSALWITFLSKMKNLI